MPLGTFLEKNVFPSPAKLLFLYYNAFHRMKVTDVIEFWIAHSDLCPFKGRA